MSIPVVIYLRQRDRALVAVGPPDYRPSAEVVAGTIQITVSQEQWQAYNQVHQKLLGQGRELVIKADGSTDSVMRTPSLLEQAQTVLTDYISNPAPLPIETAQALKVLIRVVRGQMQ